MSDAIIFNNISKQYRLGLVSTRTLSHDLNRWWKMNMLRQEDPYLKIGETNDRAHRGESDYVWALRDIDFKVEQGDVLGIIGKNGAGKSTLLKILSKVTAPTTGTIKAKGRIASLLEVGTGFHPEMTGRENIFLNGAILGMTKAEINRKLDEIVDFSGVERYIDTPVKRYSSGMMVRLGFAVAAHLDPEILVVDEVLAVGDAEFQKKAIGKMQDVSKGEGRTVLFVSHNMPSIKQLCSKTLLMENGSVMMIGKTENVCETYLKSNSNNIFNSYKYSVNKNNYIGDNYVQLIEMKLVDLNIKSINLINITDEFGVYIKYDIIDDLYKPDLSCLISTIEGIDIFHSVFKNNDYSSGTKEYILWFPANFFNNSEYIFKIGITTSNPLMIHLQYDIKFEINEDFSSYSRKTDYVGKYHGLIRPDILKVQRL